jgi:hypothetical protein
MTMHTAQQTPRPAELPRPAEAPTVFNPRTSPQTPEDVQALRIRLQDLRRELQDAAERRNSVAGNLRSADIDARAGYQARLKVLDERIITIENEITATGRQLSNAPTAALVGGTQAPPPLPPSSNLPDEAVPIVAILSVFVFLPLTITLCRYIWKRSTTPNRAAMPDHATQQRLEHLQQAVDTIAIEVERISENQRFVTRLLSERAVGPGESPAEPVRVGQKQPVSSERG